MVYINLFTDGATRYSGQYEEELGTDKLGAGAIGVVIRRNDEIIGEYGRAIGPTTNNAAEYEALLHGVLLCWAADLGEFIAWSDSKLVVDQVNRVQLCRSASLQPLLSAVWDIQKVCRFRLLWTPRTDVGIQLADNIANLALNKVNTDWRGVHIKKPRRRKSKKTLQATPSF